MKFHRVWLAIIVAMIALEWWALRRSAAGDTLSEWVWTKVSQWPMRALLGAFLFWLCYHFLWAGPGRLTRWDALWALAGVAYGVAAVRWGWR